MMMTPLVYWKTMPSYDYWISDLQKTIGCTALIFIQLKSDRMIPLNDEKTDRICCRCLLKCDVEGEFPSLFVYNNLPAWANCVAVLTCVPCTCTYTISLRRWTWTGDFKCREVKTGFFRKRWTQTGSSGTLIGWKSGQTTIIPLWDRMEGAWLWTLMSKCWCCRVSFLRVLLAKSQGCYSETGLHIVMYRNFVCLWRRHNCNWSLPFCALDLLIYEIN